MKPQYTYPRYRMPCAARPAPRSRRPRAATTRQPVPGDRTGDPQGHLCELFRQDADHTRGFGRRGCQADLPRTFHLRDRNAGRHRHRNGFQRLVPAGGDARCGDDEPGALVALHADSGSGDQTRAARLERCAGRKGRHRPDGRRRLYPQCHDGYSRRLRRGTA